jgi:putative ABC transport system ATP-binding protein
MAASYVIEAQDIHRSMRLGPQELCILRGISLQVAAGEWVALTGPSGSGKSTLLGLLAGLDRPTRGRLWLDGEDIGALPESRLARLRNQKIGVIFQAFHLIPTLTAQENVEAPLYIGPRRREARALAQTMLARVGLEPRGGHLPHQLSGGEQQRVAIARALVAGPRLLLADEPTGNLDSAASRQVLALLAQLREQLGLTIIMVTHEPQVAALADRRLHLVDGQLADLPAEPRPGLARAGQLLAGGWA